MTPEELEQIEHTHDVGISYNPESRKIAITGAEEAVDDTLRAIAPMRAELIAALRIRQGLGASETVTKEVSATSVPPLAVQRENYKRWYTARSTYYHPTPEQLDLMFAQLEEGDEIIPDFAHSFGVRKANGTLIAIDRRGHTIPPQG